MEARIVLFPETRVAVVEHREAPEREYESVKKLVAWRIENGAAPERHATYGVHFFDPRDPMDLSFSRDPALEQRVDFCVAYDGVVLPNRHGVVGKVIPASRCAVARHLGSRQRNAAPSYLLRDWLPGSGEHPSGQPLIFHYLNVGPQVQADAMVTDVYLPLS